MKYPKLIIALTLFSGVMVFSFASVSTSQTKRLQKIAKEYSSYQITGKKSTKDDLEMEWAIQLCAPMRTAWSDTLYLREHTNKYNFSTADKPSPHGNKLYTLYVKDRDSYLSKDGKPQPHGQVLVKETWSVTKVDSGYMTPGRIWAKKNDNDGNWYIPGNRSNLFIMYKEKESDDNDKGWVYGIMDIDSAHTYPIISQGKLSNCIGCHSHTKYDHIFGLN
ncbi:MAG: hypothetical protein JWO03_2837 [Bacteroidetes bacterium]|nr:hypothetical protein [Bacteroidota bacterium]